MSHYDKMGSFEIVDGKQRIKAICDFFENKVPIFGKNYYRDFTDEPNFIAHCLRFHVNNLPDRKSVLMWYIELNEGGIVHSVDEIKKVKKLLEEEREKNA